MTNKFVGLDGDSIGRVIESLLIKNKIKEVMEFSEMIQQALDLIKEKVISRGGKVLFCTGDSILFYGDFNVEFCNWMLKEFKKRTGRTASVGIGEKTAETYLGLKLAKSQGGDKVVEYTF